MKNRVVARPAPLEAPTVLTIGRLAKAAGVGVETVRYYQSRGLLRVPAASGGFRIYPAAAIARIAFIKRAQALGFTLDEVRSLLDLEDGRNRRAIQSVTQARLGQIEDKLADLHRMREVLSELLHRCRQTGPTQACPIIETLAGARSTT
jgi:Hg(II)-responsive transcriptional regulator